MRVGRWAEPSWLARRLVWVTAGPAGSQRVEDAVRGSSAGDKLESVYRSHGAEALRLAYLLTGDRELAEDLAQEAFVRVARRIGGLRNDDSIRWYLRRTVINLANSHLRRRRVERSHLP